MSHTGLVPVRFDPVVSVRSDVQPYTSINRLLPRNTTNCENNSGTNEVESSQTMAS